MSPKITRRAVLLGGAVGLAGLGVAGGTYGLIDSGRLAGKSRLDLALGRCDVPVDRVSAEPGPVWNGSFFSAKRRTQVGYRVVYPPGSAIGDQLPVCLVLHGYGRDQTGAIEAGAYHRYVAARVRAGGSGFALAACAGGPGYWHPHAADDPLGMLLDEFLPLLGQLGLAADERDRIGVLGYSMGGYGALLCGITRPARFAAIVASAPAFWRSYAEAERVNPNAFDSADEWQAYDLLSRAHEFGGLPVRVDCGTDDSFAPAVRALRDRLADPTVVHLAKGCHDDSFWQHAAPAQIEFIGTALRR